MASEGVPKHVAIIMDGNGRWAQQRGLPRTEGHSAGADSVRAALRACGELGVEYLTLYSFSTENWGRPEDEVQTLMALLERYLRTELEELLGQRVRLRAIGELERLPEPVRMLIEQVSEATAHNTRINLTLALSYGSRAELVHAVRGLARQVQRGEITPEEIDDEAVSRSLYTRDIPDPELLIRTSGELRLSNFLLWQVAYAELYVTDVLWPDFRRPHLEVALDAYARRQRRFGKTGAQIEDDA